MKQFCFLIAFTIGITTHAQWKAYSPTPGMIKSSAFRLLVNGTEVPVEAFKDIHYARFVIEGKITVEVQVAADVPNFTLSPRSYNIAVEQAGNKLRFSIDRPRKLILQVGPQQQKLFLFADAPEQDAPQLTGKNVINVMDFVTDASGRTLQTQQLQKAIDRAAALKAILYVPNGTYRTGTLVLRRDVQLYLRDGALIQGSDDINDYNDNGDNKTGVITRGRGALIYFDRADDAKIYGRGVLAISGTAIKNKTGIKIRVINVRSSNNVTIEDIIIRDSGGFTVHLQNSNKLLMKGYKIINDITLPNEDGTDPDGCNGVVIDDVFMYTSDDAIAVKADHQPCENILVQNCVFWTVKSALKVGSDPAFGAKNITFSNNDVVHADRALAVYASAGKVDGVRFINNKSEFIGGNAKRQLIVFQVSNAKEDNTDTRRRGIGSIKNIEVINYTAYHQSERPSLISGTVAKDGTLHKVSGVLFQNLVIEGKKCLSPQEARIITTPKQLPADPNIPDKDQKATPLKKPLEATENIRFL
ncbi:glycosyl hydrolase family 28 protein [Niabella sp.]|uniref:glycoside hydrolase family 28 protein n=1 Tax=Niabella sp. TaxID=1962976 RepID=UPI0026160FFF|nr:glycosyl hydrolase family 28 protein [Niabella sp.]